MRRIAVLAVPLALMSAGATMLGLFVARRPRDLPAHVVAPIFYEVPLALAFAVVGAAIVWRHRRHPVGWLLSTLATLLGYGIFVEGYAAWRWPGLDWLLWTWSVGVGAVYATLASTLLLFPTGAAPTRRWSAFGRAVAIYAIASMLVCALSPWPRTDNLTILAVVDHRGWPPTSPIGWTGPTWLATVAASVTPVGFLMVLAATASLVRRWRRSPGDERQQIKWLALAGLIATGELLVGAALAPFAAEPASPVDDLLGNAVFDLIMATIPIAIGLGVVRYRLYDIDTLISRTLVFGGLTAFIGVTYVVAVVAGGQVVGRWAGSATLRGLAATVIVALAVEPLRGRLQALADRVVFGARARPYELMARLDRVLAEAPAPDAMLGAIAEAAGRAGRARAARVTVTLADGREVTATWPPSAASATGPILGIVDDGTVIGGITVEPAASRAADRALLSEIAAIATGTLRNIRLDAALRTLRATVEFQNIEVAASRHRLAAAADIERRHLAATVTTRVGPDLAGLRGAISDIESGTTDLEAGCRHLAGQATRVAEEVRALSRGVLPSVLADHGIAAAAKALLRRVDARAGLLAEPALADQRFPRPVETAIYLALQEVVDAAGRQRATTVLVRLWRRDDSLVFTVEHDRPPVPAATSAPLSGADRVAALGGVLRIEPGANGTRVTGSVPLSPRAPG